MADTFEKIEVCAEDINKVSGELAQVMTTLSKTNESIVTSINTVSAVTEEVSARSSETLSASENDALVVDEITNVIMDLNEKAKQLNQ
jgi:methyl-accepting chemotaxis protein